MMTWTLTPLSPPAEEGSQGPVPRELPTSPGGADLPPGCAVVERWDDDHLDGDGGA